MQTAESEASSPRGELLCNAVEFLVSTGSGMRDAARQVAGWVPGSNPGVRENSPALRRTGNLVSRSGFLLYSPYFSSLLD